MCKVINTTEESLPGQVKIFRDRVQCKEEAFWGQRGQSACFSEKAHSPKLGIPSYMLCHYGVQAIPVPQVTFLSLANREAVGLNQFPFSVENTSRLQKLWWSGQAIHLKQLKALNKSVLASLRDMSLFLEFIHDEPKHGLYTGSRPAGAFHYMQNLRSLTIRNYTLANPELLDTLLPLAR